MTPKQFNKIFDHTLLKPPATKDDLKVICDLAMKYGFCTIEAGMLDPMEYISHVYDFADIDRAYENIKTAYRP